MHFLSTVQRICLFHLSHRQRSIVIWPNIEVCLTVISGPYTSEYTRVGGRTRAPSRGRFTGSTAGPLASLWLVKVEYGIPQDLFPHALRRGSNIIGMQFNKHPACICTKLFMYISIFILPMYGTPVVTCEMLRRNSNANVTNWGKAGLGWRPARPTTAYQGFSKNRHNPVMVYNDLMIRYIMVHNYNKDRSQPVTIQCTTLGLGHRSTDAGWPGWSAPTVLWSRFGL